MLEPLLPKALPGLLAAVKAREKLIRVEGLRDRLPAEEVIGVDRERCIA